MYPQQYSSQQQRYGATAVRTGPEKVAFLRKVYALFTTSVLAAAVGAMFAMYAGAGASAATIKLSDGTVRTIPPLVALLSSGGILTWIISLAILFGAFFGAQMVSRTKGVNLIALHGAAFISGVIIAPMIFFAMLMATQGQTLVASPVRDAFMLATIAFAGLSSYTLVTKKDFSYLRGFLWMGFFIVLGGIFLTLFIHSSVFALAIESAGVLVFGGFILYDTSRILRSGNDNPVTAAIMLYLDFFNLFIMLLSILSSRRN